MACVINGVRPILLLTGTSSSNLRALYPARLCVAGTERGAVKCDSSPCFSRDRVFAKFVGTLPCNRSPSIARD